MNSGKVRIYELSKDLNLDNRDILSVCEQLNIQVKNHSSTISEDDAARIRDAAQSYSSRPTSQGKQPSPKAISPSSKLITKKPPERPIIQKQQILEVRRINPVEAPQPPRPIQSPANPEVEAGAPSKPLPVKPERETSKRDIAANVQLEVSPSLVRNGEPATVPPTPPSVEKSSFPEETGEQDAVGVVVENIAAQPPLERPEALSTKSPVGRQGIKEGIKERPLMPPTAAPSPPVDPPRRGNASSSLVKRPVPKPVKSDDRQSGRSLDDRSGEKPSLGVSPSPTKPSLPKPSVLRKQDTLAEQAVQLDAPPAALKPKSVPEIQRPKRIIPAGQRDSQSDKSGIGELEKGASGIVTTPVVDLPETEDFKLRRPSVPRLKKDKERDDEDDELQEVRSVKAGKVATKGKRRGSTLLDEDLDEEFIDDDLSIPAPTVLVSLSLARPAKPKSAKASQPKPMMAPKAKKQVGRDSDEETRNRSRRDRREEPAEVERPKKITLTGRMTVQDLAHLLMVPETEVIKTLFLKGIAANINQALELDTIQMVAEALEVEVETVKEESAARKVTEMLDLEDLEHLLRRPPVVTIMGHVDHGKTTLLDSIRKTKVAQGEAGGITQHIGAYHVDVQHEDKIQQVVFLDTPGHEAFTAMRARGARVTDIAVLVVAADDGVQPQTIEAISHAKAAGVPIVVAINKVDKEGANPDRVKQELSEHGLVPEEWGGDTIMVPVSAIKGENLDSLLEMILLVAELEDLSANPDRLAKGTVIEANLDRARGPVATLLVQNGTLRIGDILVAGSASGKVRAMVDDLGRRVEEAGPSFAVEVLGLGSVPAAGDEFQVYQDEKDARAVVSSMEDKQRQERLQKQAMAARRISLNTMSARAQEGDLKELNLILKADVQGSVEAILNALQQLPQNEVQLRVLLAAPGEVTQTDIDLAAASSAVILAFNTTLAIGVRQIADDLGVDVRDYNIIYKLLDDVQGAMEGLLEPELVEEPLGQAEVRAVFQVGRGLVAGCYVQSGKVTRNCNIRVYRNKGIIYEGVLDSLKRMKEDAKEVATGYECGIGSNSFNAWEIGDIIEAFRMVTKRRTLSTN